MAFGSHVSFVFPHGHLKYNSDTGDRYNFILQSKLLLELCIFHGVLVSIHVRCVRAESPYFPT